MELRHVLLSIMVGAFAGWLASRNLIKLLNLPAPTIERLVIFLLHLGPRRAAQLRREVSHIADVGTLAEFYSMLARMESAGLVESVETTVTFGLTIKQRYFGLPGSLAKFK